MFVCVCAYFFCNHLFSDPRTREWPMMSSPFPTLAVCLTYAYCVKVSHYSYVLYLHLYTCAFLFLGDIFILLLLLYFVVAFVMYKQLHFAPFSIPLEMVHSISYYVFIRPLLISSSFHFQYHYKYILVRIHKTTMPRSVRMSVREKAKSVYGIFKVFSAIS